MLLVLKAAIRRTSPKRLGNLRSRDVLAFPAEGIAHPIVKVKVAVFRQTEKIARSEEGVVLDKDISQDLLLCRLGIAIVPVEAAEGSIQLDLGDELAWFSSCCLQKTRK